MDGGAAYNPRTVEEVFRDFKGRRAGIIKALTTGNTFFFFSFFSFSFHISKFEFEFVFVGADVEEFYQQCDPGQNCLSSLFISYSTLCSVCLLRSCRINVNFPFKCHLEIHHYIYAAILFSVLNVNFVATEIE